MASLQIYQKLCFFKKILDVNAVHKFQTIRCYAQFASTRVRPILKREQIQALDETELNKLAHVKFLPAWRGETCSDFYDPVVNKFTNYVMRHGRKDLARTQVRHAFATIKRIQVEKYNNAPPEEKEKIETDPKKIFFRALENCCPAMELKGMKKGGITYQVPIPCTDNRKTFLGMNWLIQAGKDKDQKLVRFYHQLALEIVSASENEGRVVNRKRDLYRQCEANRAYAHFRWS